MIHYVIRAACCILYIFVIAHSAPGFSRYFRTLYFCLFFHTGWYLDIFIFHWWFRHSRDDIFSGIWARFDTRQPLFVWFDCLITDCSISFIFALFLSFFDCFGFLFHTIQGLSAAHDMALSATLYYTHFGFRQYTLASLPLYRAKNTNANVSGDNFPRSDEISFFAYTVSQGTLLGQWVCSNFSRGKSRIVEIRSFHATHTNHFRLQSPDEPHASDTILIARCRDRLFSLLGFHRRRVAFHFMRFPALLSGFLKNTMFRISSHGSALLSPRRAVYAFIEYYTFMVILSMMSISLPEALIPVFLR